MNEASRDLRYVLDSSKEEGFICSRRFVKSADFSHELERGILNFFGSDERLKVEKSFDIPTHSIDLSVSTKSLYFPVDGRNQVYVSVIRTRSLS
jgi:hypothetical protein